MITWITGNSGSGKTTLSNKIRKNEIQLDGDELRRIWTDLGFDKEDRIEQNLRTARLAVLLDKQGFDVIVSTICPYRQLRSEIKKLTNCRFIQLDGGKVGPEYPYEE